MWHSTKTTTNLQDGREVPILALDKYIKTPVNQWPNLACSPTILNMPCLKVGGQLAAGTMTGFLDRAGEERFLAKAARFRADLAKTEASQSLYQGIMGALGYSKNKLPFLELARSLPLRILESITEIEITDEGRLAWQQSLLLGAAGLLPSQRQDWQQENRLDDKWIDKLERLWTSSHYTGAMSRNVWHLFKVRPNNSPIRRLVAMSYLLLRYQEKGILKGLVSLIKEVPVNRGYHKIQKGLLVTANGYWASHFNFGSGGRIRSLTLIGSGRAADITVNVLLPFTFAWSQFTSRPKLKRKAFDLYRCHPRLTVNSVERHMMGQLGLSGSLLNSAQRQQGLIHIYSSLCTQGKCNDCSLSQFKQQDTLIALEY